MLSSYRAKEQLSYVKPLLLLPLYKQYKTLEKSINTSSSYTYY